MCERTFLSITRVAYVSTQADFLLTVRRTSAVTLSRESIRPVFNDSRVIRVLQGDCALRSNEIKKDRCSSERRSLTNRHRLAHRSHSCDGRGNSSVYRKKTHVALSNAQWTIRHESIAGLNHSTSCSRNILFNKQHHGYLAICRCPRQRLASPQPHRMPI